MADDTPPRAREKDLVMQVAQMRLLKRNRALKDVDRPDSLVRSRIRGELEK
jgi:hypothetical protein